jgi:hypothetical protein
LAHRPLPSLMMATCRGIMLVSGISRVELVFGSIGAVEHN